MDSCKTCKHWEIHDDNWPTFPEAWGNCYGLCQADSPVKGAHNMETREDFYCNQWEEKSPSSEGRKD